MKKITWEPVVCVGGWIVALFAVVFAVGIHNEYEELLRERDRLVMQNEILFQALDGLDPLTRQVLFERMKQ